MGGFEGRLVPFVDRSCRVTWDVVVEGGRAFLVVGGHEDRFALGEA